jgi:hypothetical protein
MYVKRLSLPVGLLLFGVLWAACVDVPSDPGTNVNPDYRSLVRFVHAVPGGTSGDIKVDGSVVATLSPGTPTQYLNEPSGVRSVSFAAGTAQTLTLTSEEQSTVLVYSTVTGIGFLNLQEGRWDKNNGVANVAKVHFINVAQGSAPNISFHDNTFDGTELSANVVFASTPPYDSVSAGQHTVVVVSNGGYVTTISPSQVVPPVTDPLSKGSGTFTLTATGGLAYKIDVTSNNSLGFYTGAHFHHAAAGADGPVVHPIDVTGQIISFPTDTLKGSLEVPEVSTDATGIGTFFLADSGLVYSLTVTKGFLADTVFTGAHFHNAAPGVNGPVVRTIDSDTVGDAAFKGTWKSTDSEPLTPALIAELMAGNIYANVHSTDHPAGVMRAQLVPDPTTTNTFEGVWDDPTLTDSLKSEFNAGNIYVNFQTAAHPNGQVRGQITVDPAGGLYGVASLPAATYEAGRMYTVIATGAGPTLGLTKLSDRQAGLTKQATQPPAPKTGQARNTRTAH